MQTKRRYIYIIIYILIEAWRMERTSKVLAYKSDVWFQECFKQLVQTALKDKRRFFDFIPDLPKYSKCGLRSEAVSRALGALGGHPDQRARCPEVFKALLSD